MWKLVRYLGWPGAVIAGTAFVSGLYLNWKGAQALGWSGPTWAFLGGVLFVLCMLALEAERRYGSKREPKSSSSEAPETASKLASVQFYSDQSDMIEGTGGLSGELKRMRNGWVAWESGGHFLRQGDHVIRHIDRMLIAAPGYLATREAGRSWDRDAADHANTSIKAQKKALDAGIDVRTTKGPLLNCVIHDPQAEDAWARIQIQLWPLASTYWPSFRAEKKDNPDLFNRIVEAYEAQWEAARPLKGPRSGESDLGPVRLRLRDQDGESLLRLTNKTDEMASFWARVVISEDPEQFFPASRRRAYAPGKSYFACWETTGIARTDLPPADSDEAVLLRRKVVDDGTPPTLQLVWPHCGQGGTENESLVSSKTWVQGQEVPGVELAVTIETGDGVVELPLKQRYRVTSTGFLEEINNSTG